MLWKEGIFSVNYVNYLSGIIKEARMVLLSRNSRGTKRRPLAHEWPINPDKSATQPPRPAVTYIHDQKETHRDNAAEKLLPITGLHSQIRRLDLKCKKGPQNPAFTEVAGVENQTETMAHCIFQNIYPIRECHGKWALQWVQKLLFFYVPNIGTVVVYTSIAITRSKQRSE